MSENTCKRDGFSSRLGVLAATLGSAVGLGNIWKFPYLTGENGGASFLIIYLLATLVVGLPVMIAEIMFGRNARANAVTTFRRVTPGGGWSIIGIAGVTASLLILAYYTDVAGWVFAYIFKSLSGQLGTTDPAVSTGIFGKLVSSPIEAVGWQLFDFAIITGVLLCGVSKGIEKAAKVLMPVLFLLLCGVCIRSLTLPGALEGLTFLFSPDFAKITPAVVLTALGLAFFKLSLGMGTMITYGSYFGEDQDIPGTTTRVMVSDLTVSMLAGIAIFPAVFALGFDPAAGPELLFITIPAVFSSMPMGELFMAVFFVLTGIATIGAQLSLLEVPVACMTETLGCSRPKAVVFTVVPLMLFGLTATLSMTPVLDHVTVFGRNLFDTYDYLSQNILMPAGGFLVCIVTGWVVGKDRVRALLSNNGTLCNEKVISIFLPVIKYVSPVLVLIIMLNGLGILTF